MNSYLHYAILRMRARLRRLLTPYLKKMRRASLLRRERYIFTDKKHPEKGIFSTAMGLIAVTGIVLSIYFTFLRGGETTLNDALGVVLSFVFGIIGLTAGIIAHREKDVFLLFPNFGIAVNVLALAGCIALLCIGLFV